jgi:hypothetical protein
MEKNETIRAETDEEGGFWSKAAQELSDDDLDAFARFVERKAESRARAQGRLNQGDFLAGAMCAWFALGREDRLPAFWVFGTMAGRSILPEGLAQIVERRERLEQRVPKLQDALAFIEEVARPNSGSTAEEVRRIVRREALAVLKDLERGR